jgi:predicted ABC-type ATPase
MDKRILILAGPNGAGKTTFAREFLVREVSCPAFVNADLIAAGFRHSTLRGQRCVQAGSCWS